MTIQDLLEKNGGVIEWTEGPHENEPNPYEKCQMNLDQLGCIRIEYQKDDGEWAEWHDSALGHRSDGNMINAILAAHAKALGVEEMLAVLKEMKEFAQENFITPNAHPILDRIDAAIKKAEGVEG